MMAEIPLGNVTSVQHLDILVPSHIPNDPLRRLEIYTGWVGAHQVGGGTLTHVTVDSFVPVEPNKVKFWPENLEELGLTFTVSPTAFDLAEDEATLTAIL
jgi:hypothetical protein